MFIVTFIVWGRRSLRRLGFRDGEYGVQGECDGEYGVYGECDVSMVCMGSVIIMV